MAPDLTIKSIVFGNLRMFWTTLTMESLLQHSKVSYLDSGDDPNNEHRFHQVRLNSLLVICNLGSCWVLLIECKLNFFHLWSRSAQILLCRWTEVFQVYMRKLKKSDKYLLRLTNLRWVNLLANHNQIKEVWSSWDSPDQMCLPVTARLVHSSNQSGCASNLNNL